MEKSDFEKRFKKDIFPADWVNPKPAEKYDLVVLGGGPGGMTAAIVARSQGARVALVEKEHLGGECLSYGCIPSKAFLRSSRVAREIHQASSFGMVVPKGWKVDFKAVIERVHEKQTTLSPHDSPIHLKNLGIDVFFGEGRFTGRNTATVGTQSLHFKKAIIATGTQPIFPPVPGLEPGDYLTNQNVFHLSSLPARLAVIGAGPISCELSQAFLRFGSEVVLITHGPKLLSREETLVSERIRRVFEDEGMKIVTRSKVIRAEKKGKEKILYLDSSKEPLRVDAVLAGIGRRPAIEGLDLEKAEVGYDQKTGITTDDYLQTSNPDVYAAGDVTSPYKFTHMSKELCTLAVANALNGNREKKSALIVPWCTFTDPELAHIGLIEEEAKKQGIATETVVIEMAEVDRAVVDGETNGFVKLIVRENRDQIIGATIMAAHAGEMVAEVGVAMNMENGLLALLKTVHPFPTQAQILRMAAEAIIKKRKTLQHV